MRTDMGKSAIRMLVLAATSFALCSRLFSAADDFDSLGSEIAAANSGGSGAITLGQDIILSAALPPITGSLTIDGGGRSISGNDAQRPGGGPRLGELTGSPAYYPIRDRSPAVDYAPPSVCSLAHQIIAAKSDQPSGGCPAGSGTDTIILDKNIVLFEALPPITSHIIIEVNGHSISGDGRFRIFDVDGGILTVKHLTMTGGNGLTQSDGAIRLHNGGRAQASDSKFIENQAAYGGAAFIPVMGAKNSWLTVKSSRFVGNTGNATYAAGGAISVSSSSSFIRNSGTYGVTHVLNPMMRLDVTNSSFFHNYTPAISAENDATVNVTHVTIEGTALRLPKDNYTTYGRVNLRNSLIYNWASAKYCDKLQQYIGNIIKLGDCTPALSGDPALILAKDSSTNLELLPGSPAINAADPRICSETDQLGNPRAQVGRCDIGAIETVPVSRDLANCSVTTTHGLNFRAAPAGERIGSVPENATMPASARTPGWFRIKHRGASGWISADYVTTEGACNQEAT